MHALTGCGVGLNQLLGPLIFVIFTSFEKVSKWPMCASMGFEHMTSTLHVYIQLYEKEIKNKMD